MTQVLDTFAAVRAMQTELGGNVGLVPTMGYLHEGHLSLVTRARSCDVVTMSVFVNPLQFNESSDLDAYPRDLDRDVALAAEAGVDIVFAPKLKEMYAGEPATRVSVAPLTATMEGAHRPGHFEGVATVVAKLFAGTQPDKAYFGRKDAQQLAVVTKMAEDLSFPVAVIGCPIIRHASGLAMSSRNSRLQPAHLDPALALSRGLMEAADAIEHGERSAAGLELLAMGVLVEAEGVQPEYAVVADRATMTRIEGEVDRPAILAVAAWVGGVRLIDNIHIDVADGATIVDRGERLHEPSVLFAEPGGDP